MNTLVELLRTLGCLLFWFLLLPLAGLLISTPRVSRPLAPAPGDG
ncbi:MAG TPA: hypothetical protein VH207_05750 [Chthoniobacterales bacterium]|nr:hypothetical protein [Chthoniobacterales bacterium]